MIYAAILAGGIGKRIERFAIPKQFINIGGIPIIVVTLRRFLDNSRFDVIYVAVHKDWITYAQNLFEKNFSKNQLSRLRIVSGGKERLDSFANIMNDIILQTGMSENDILVCHDSVRPFVNQQMIDDCIDETLKHGLALTVVPVVDTIHTSHDNDGFIDNALDRSNLYNGQTPSGFNLHLLNDALKHFDEQERAKVTGTTQLMLKLGHKIKMVKGHTSNFKITTDNDLDIADRIIKSASKKHNINLLDCTLRDGGIVIDFDFGIDRMQEIKNTLENSGVNYIECGYINERKGSPCGKTCFDNEISIRNTLLASGKRNGISYVAIIDHGTFNLDNLHPRDSQGIDGIRYAFHKEDMRAALTEAKKIIAKGYNLFIQPMVSIRYSDEEFREMIELCNAELSAAYAFYIVDSFGQMDNMMLLHKLEIADLYVSGSMKIGFHGHNNRQMAYSNAIAMVGSHTKHDLILDSTVMGMGKGAGNLCTELIMPVLNAEGGNYKTIGIYQLINDYIAELQKQHPWGYSLDYYLSSLYGCTPSYIKMFTKDSRVTTDVLISLLQNIPEGKKAACDKDFAQEYLANFFSRD